MKVTFVSFYGVDDAMAASARLRRTVELLRERGWTVEVISPVKDTRPTPANKFVKLACWLGTLQDLSKRALREKTDAYFISAPPMSMLTPALVLKLLTRTPLIFEERDPLTINVLNNFKIVRNNKLSQLIEYQLLRRAAAIVAATSGVKSEIVARWPDLAAKNQFVVVPNGFWRKDYKFLANVAAGERRGPCHLVHTGNFYGTRNPGVLLDALKLVKERNPGARLDELLHFTFIGQFERDGAREFLERADSLGLKALFTIEPLKPREQAITQVYRGDVALLITHSKGSEGAVPAKLYEYIAVGRPIFAVTKDPLVVDVMQKNKLGWTVAHAEAEKLAETLWWLAKNVEEVRGMPMPGLNLGEYDSETHLNRLHDVLSDVASQAGAGK